MRTLKDKYSEDFSWKIIKEGDSGTSRDIQKHVVEFVNGCILIQIFSVIHIENGNTKRALQSEIVCSENDTIIEAFYGFEKRFGFVSLRHFYGLYKNQNNKSITNGIINKVSSDLPIFNLNKDQFELGYDDVYFESNGMLGDVYECECQIEKDNGLEKIMELEIKKYFDDELFEVL